FAALGEDASEVIDEAQFEAAREQAGLRYERFLPQFKRDEFGYPVEVGLLIESASSDGLASSETIWLDDLELGKFVQSLDEAIARRFSLVAWRGYDLEVQGDAAVH